MRVARLALVLAIAALLVGGCRLPENALDGPLAAPLRITATTDAVEVDAPTWYAADTVVYLCPTRPPALPEPGPERVGWAPGGGCHDFGHVAAPDGLEARLPLDALTAAERPAFEAANDWYVLLVKVEGSRAIAAIVSSFTAPIQPAG